MGIGKCFICQHDLKNERGITKQKLLEMNKNPSKMMLSGDLMCEECFQENKNFQKIQDKQVNSTVTIIDSNPNPIETSPKLKNQIIERFTNDESNVAYPENHGTNEWLRILANEQAKTNRLLKSLIDLHENQK